MLVFLQLNYYIIHNGNFVNYQHKRRILTTQKLLLQWFVDLQVFTNIGGPIQYIERK
jgi:hypothetical protein